jgi:hypothetical protein
MSRSFTIAPKTLRVALATVAATTGMAATSGVAAAADHGQDEITFTSHVYVAPQGDGSSRVVLIGDTCTLQADGGAAEACRISAVGRLQADGTGTAKAVVSTSDRVLQIEENFSSTGGTGIGWGPVKEVGAGGPILGWFTAEFNFAPTEDPNVLYDWGTIHVTH